MIVTEQEAATKRCQESFGDQHVTNGGYMVSLSGAGGALAVVTSPSHCIGSACMAWRWAWSNDFEQSRTHGYCGKAGKP